MYRDRYLQEAAEKKALAENLEKSELDLDSKKKELMEIRELYDFQKQVSTELRNKLEITKIKLDETEHSLSDHGEKHTQEHTRLQKLYFSQQQLLERTTEKLEETEYSFSVLREQYRQLNEEKEKLKSDLVRSGKAFFDNAAERGTQLENTVSYISSVLADLVAGSNASEKKLVQTISPRGCFSHEDMEENK